MESSTSLMTQFYEGTSIFFLYAYIQFTDNGGVHRTIPWRRTLSFSARALNEEDETDTDEPRDVELVIALKQVGPTTATGSCEIAEPHTRFPVTHTSGDGRVVRCLVKKPSCCAGFCFTASADRVVPAWESNPGARGYCASK